MKISFTQPGRVDVRLDSEKYTWNVDADGDLQITDKETKQTVGIYVKGTWWSVVDFDVEPKTTTNISNYITTTHPNIIPANTTATYIPNSYTINPNQAM